MQLNRSFARRIGKTLSSTAQNILVNDLPKLKYQLRIVEQLPKNKKTYLEIGIGDGVHFTTQAELNPNSLFIGVEVYLNGVAKTILEAKRKAISNILLWPDDLDLIMQEMPPERLDGIYILFPNPWPKSKQQKKRLFNEIRFNILKSKLKPGAFINFASDIEGYFYNARNIILHDQDFKLLNNDYGIPHANYITTKYHQKAIMEGRIPQFLQVVYRSN